MICHTRSRAIHFINGTEIRSVRAYGLPTNDIVRFVQYELVLGSQPGDSARRSILPASGAAHY